MKRQSNQCPTHARIAALVLSAMLVVGAVACQTPAERLDFGSVEQEVKLALLEFERQLNAADYSAALGFYANDPRFSAYEDGQLQYDSWEKISEVYAQLPSYGKGRFSYGEPDVLAINDSTAWLATTFATSFGEAGAEGFFEFSGTISILMARSVAGNWQGLKIHSSSGRPTTQP